MNPMRPSRPILLVLFAIACTPTPDRPARRARPAAAEGLTPAGADPFTGLLVSDDHLPWVFKHGVGPKPPAAGFEKLQSFPVPLAPPKIEPPKAPRVLRVQPTGEIESSREISITFSQPMVPLASVEQMRELPVPVTLEPSLPGRWRWMGTSLLVFEPARRLPGATHFTVTIPGGLRSALGTELAEPAKYTFSTPPMRATGFYPEYQALPESPILIYFNQDIDPAALEPYIHLNLIPAEGKPRPVRWRRVTREQFQAHPFVKKHELGWEENRTFAAFPEKPLLLDRQYEIILLEGAPGAEGPRRTTRPQRTEFSTLGPMRVTRLTCTGKSRKPCRPNFDWTFEFSNEVAMEEDDDGESFRKFVRVTPAVKDLEVSLWGAGGSISGDFRPGTAYTVTILAGVMDQYKQKLAASRTATILVGDQWPDLQLPSESAGVLESTSRALPVPSVNILRPVTVRLFRVEPRELFSAIRVAGDTRQWGNEEQPTEEFGNPAATWKMTFNRRKNVREPIPLDLDRALGGQNGFVLAELEAPDLRADPGDTIIRRVFLQVASIGITATHDRERLHVLTTGLTDGRPRGSLPVRLLLAPASRTTGATVVWEGKTGADGTVMIPWRARRPDADRRYAIVAGPPADQAFLLVSRRTYGSGADSSYEHQMGPAARPSRVRSLIFTERDPYRPGETVELAGWLRRDPEGPQGRLGALSTDPLEQAFVEWELYDPLNEVVEKGKTPLDQAGAFHVRWTSRKDATLGGYRFQGLVHGVPGIEPTVVTGRFSVLAFRAPEHVVGVTIPPATYIFGDRFLARIEGRYTFGAPMRGADVSYEARLEPAYFKPPGHAEYDFGDFDLPPWRRAGRVLYSGYATLDGHGTWTVNELLRGNGPDGLADGPGTVTLEASVVDVNRQGISARGRTLVHPASFYTGLRTPQNVVRTGEPVTVEGVIVNPDGRRVAGRALKIRALRETWRRRPPDPDEPDGKSWELVQEEKGACELTSGEQPAACRLSVPDPGYYHLEGVALDDRGRPARTRTGLWVLGAGEVVQPPEEEAQLRLTLDRDDYAPGEKARLVIQAPFFPATAVLSLDREGLVTTRVFEVKSAIHVEEIPVEEGHLPNLWVSVSLLRGRVKTAPGANPDTGRPRMVASSVRLPIRIDAKRLRVTVRPVRNLIRPGEAAELNLQTTDAAGAPVKARLAVMLVDEGVLSLLGFNLPDPLGVFFPERARWSSSDDLRSRVLPTPVFEPPGRETPDLEAEDENSDGAVTVGYGSGSSGGGRSVSIRMGAAGVSPSRRSSRDGWSGTGEGGGNGSGLDQVALRGKFATTAYYNDRVTTDADGRARLVIRMPENLTTFRVMVLAMDTVASDRFGSADERITVRKDFMLRAALPRFANHGDTFEAAVVLTSLSDREGPAEVKIGGHGFTLLDPGVRTVQLSSRRSEEVRFRVRTDNPGSARFTFAARHLDQTDGVAAPPIPVHVPASTEHTAVYGITDTAVLQPIAPPGKVFPQFGGLDLHVSSTGLLGLQDAARFLFENDWECAEATASRLVPIFSLREILPRFGLGAAGDPDRLDGLARKGIADLLGYQTQSGGFRMWPGGGVWPYPSTYVTWALLRAREAGFAVPDGALRSAAKYLGEVVRGENRSGAWWYYNYTTEIYAGWVLTELARQKVLTAQEIESAQVKRHLYRLYGERKKVGFLARTWLLHALWRLEGPSEHVKTLLRDLENSAVETAAGAHFAEVREEGLGLLMHSEARTDAVVLRVLLDVDPKHLLLSKIVRGLMASRRDGGWDSSQGNAFVLDALAAYFRVVEAEEPDFTMNAWYDRLFAGTKRFRGRSMDIMHARLPMRTLLAQGGGGLLLTKEGPGRLYYRLGLAYVPAAADLPPENHGLTVSRTYESMDEDPKAVERVSPGHWRIKAGTTVLVRLTLTAPDRRDFVALTDPLPAGLEGVDTRMKTAPQLPQRKNTGPAVTSSMRWWWWHSPTHQELRDDRFVAYYDNLYGGTYEYAYMTRATTLGTFRAPPARALEMYHPEVFGRSGGEIVEVVEPAPSPISATR